MLAFQIPQLHYDKILPNDRWPTITRRGITVVVDDYDNNWNETLNVVKRVGT